MGAKNNNYNKNNSWKKVFLTIAGGQTVSNSKQYLYLGKEKF